MTQGSPNQNTGITHCKRGHEFTPANTYVWANGERQCRTCNNARKYKGIRPWQRNRVRKPNGIGYEPGFCDPNLAPRLSPTNLDIAWAAGIYEGEGSVHKAGQINIGQKDRWILDRLQHLFGGRVSAPRPSGVHNLCISGPRGRGFAMTIYKFLSPRRKEQLRTRLLNGATK